MWHCHRRSAFPLSLLLFAFAAASSSQPDEAAGTLHVANNGSDSDRCGSTRQPCRSISRAIQQANDGDTILVGPGFYGDVNLDGDFSDPGDEALNTTSFPDACLICVNKRVRVRSTHGADLTIIDGTGTEELGPVVGVSIQVPGVSFGAESRGFTIREISNIGVSVRPEASDVTVAGNHALNNGIDDDSSGIGFFITVGAGVTRVQGNLATNNNFHGFLVAHGGVGAGSARILGNLARGNGEYGFVIEAGAAPGYAIIGNVATSNGGGFSFDGRDLLARRNIAINNGQGVSIEGENTSNMMLLESSIIGNDAGIIIGSEVPGPVDIHRSNIYGNVGGTSTTEPNCGISNQDGLVDARNNFWGLPTGPGPDPADDAGRPGCDVSAESETLVVPFATRPFPIRAQLVQQGKPAQQEIEAE